MLHSYDIFQDHKHGVYQIRTLNEVFTIEFVEKEERAIFEEVIEKYKANSKVTFQHVFSSLSKKYDKDKVVFVLNQLKENQLIDDEELKDQIILWGKQDTTHPKIKEARLGIIGQGPIYQYLEEKSRSMGYHHITKTKVGDTPTLAAVEKTIEQSDFFLVDANEWNPHLLEHINTVALAANKPWILIRGCNATNGSVGPLFYGKETGCYHCLMSRLKSQMEFLPYFEEYEKYLMKEKKAAKSDSSFALLQELLAATAVFEMTKFITEYTIPEIYGAYLTVDMASYHFSKHTVLKSPGCPACKPSVDFDLAPWLEPVTL